MGRPASFSGNGNVETVISYVGVNPISKFRQRINDTDYGRRLAGQVGHIPIGDPQVTQYLGWLPSQQGFVGAAQITNLVNAKVGLATAIPSTKPNPGVIPLTPMQQQLAQIANLSP